MGRAGGNSVVSNVLCLDCVRDHTDAYIDQNSLNCTLGMGAFDFI